MPLRYATLDVFTDRLFGGNPLAVFCDQPEMRDTVMQSIAREFNLSETVFIVPPRDAQALRRLRIFTPSRELPFAGHPTIGAAHVLVESGIADIRGQTGRFALELEAGLVPIQVARRDQGPPFLQLTAARLPESRRSAPDHYALAELLGLAASDIVSERDFAQPYSCGLPFLFIPVKSRDVLARVRVDSAVWERTIANAWATQVFVFCREPKLAGRMFFQEFGIIEDPATGSAAAALAGYLADREPLASGTLRWVVEQGFEMGRPSILHLEADKADGRVTAIRVGGTAVQMSSGTMLVEVA
jgi:trans-2,3-dihydro-3-hydroxyanthranilate isomerase